MDLKDKKCVPCSSYVPPLSSEEKHQQKAQLSAEWVFTEGESRIRRNIKFKNFKRALEFCNEVGRLAEEEKHHPEIHIGWGHCDIELWTHTNNNLVMNDFILAAKIDEAFNLFHPAAV